MDIRIIKSELHSVASKDLDIEQDLSQPDQNLQETLQAHEKKSQEENTDR